MKNTITEKEQEKRTDFLKKSGFFEEASVENPVKDKMDRIVKINDKYTIINTIITLLCKELNLNNKERDWDIIGQAVANNYNEYNQACREFQELTGDRFKISVNDLKKP